MVSDLISGEEKRQALERVIASRTFSRSDQLRGFLRYVCEAEFEGRAQEINEYVLGVSVLGRPSGYSPTEDSCVRSRAYELRNKLNGYYRLEAPDDPIQIQVRKGAYVPQFLRREEPKALETPVMEPEIVASTAVVQAIAPFAPSQVRKRVGLRPLLALVLVVVIAAPILYYFLKDKTAAKRFELQDWTPEMAALWKPFLNKDTPLVISFEIRLFYFSPAAGLVVRDFETNQPEDLPKSKPLTRFRDTMKANDLREADDYADFGSVHAGFLLGRLLGTQHQEIGIKHSGSFGWEDLRNSNVIFIGKGNVNPTIRSTLKSSDFVDDEFGLVKNVHPLPGEPLEYRSARSHGTGVKYALITVLPGPQSGHHVMILSGAGSEFLWALAEYVTDPVHVKELVAHLRLPSGELPPAYQVVIESTFESNVPLKVRYVTHRTPKVS